MVPRGRFEARVEPSPRRFVHHLPAVGLELAGGPPSGLRHDRPAVRAYIAASTLTVACMPGGADRGRDNAVSQRLTRSSYRNREHIRPRCG